MDIYFRRMMSWAAVIGVCVSTTGSAELVDFSHDILPILQKRCAKCHTHGKYKGRVSMDTREALLNSDVVVIGESGRSELIFRVTDADPDERMPHESNPLPPHEVEALRAWVDQGLVWQDGFSFAADEYVAPLRLRPVTLPSAQDGREHAIDRIIDAYHQEHQLERPPTINDATFMRRLYLDIIGVLPGPRETQAFVQDANPLKRDRLIQQVLDDRQAFADHWLSFWNDLLRNDYAGTGYIDGGRKQITNWLYASLQNNKPYDQFVRELIHPSPESEGFIRGIKWRGRVNASQVPELQFAQNISQVFLGVNMKCASCHDSFIDDWKLDDAYGLAAIVAERPLEIHRCDKPTGRTAEAAFLFPELGQIDPTLPRPERLQQLAELMVQPDNGRLARTIVNRIWQRLIGRGVVHPVDIMSNRPWSEDLLELLANHLVDHGYDLKQTMAFIVSSQAYQAHCTTSAEPPGGEYLFRGPRARRMTAEQFMDAMWAITGTGPDKPNARIPSESSVAVRAARVNADPLMRSLGRPNREQVVTTRPSELTTLQALDLSNGEVLSDLLARGAKRMLQDQAKRSDPELIQWLYWSALSRAPEPAEQEVCRTLLGTERTEQGLSDMLWAIFMLPEFQSIR